MRSRALLATAGWLAAALVATLIGIGALRLVGESIAGTSGGVLSQEEVGRELARSPAAGAGPASPSPSANTEPASGTASPTPSAPASGTGAAGTTRVLMAKGGQVTAECHGSTVQLLLWSPAQGYQTHEYTRGVAEEAEVDFRGPAGRSKIKVRCDSSGVPAAEIDED
jgi:hypothetical protein